MKPEYIIVQAGGKGTRLGHLTKNKPKALVPVDNLPMLFHLFHKYPDSNYVVIGDYQFNVLDRYLSAFAPVSFRLVCATGYSGTCAGIQEAVETLPQDTPFLLIWSDLILPREFELPESPGNYIGIAKDFPCRWKYEGDAFHEEASSNNGVAGLFLFQNKAELGAVPSEGEFVRWLSEREISFQSLPLYHVKEYGLLSEYEKLESSRCRPFNRTYIENGLFVKLPVDAQGEGLAQREIAWYQKVQGQGFQNVPHIDSYHPLKMEYINGKAIYEYSDFTPAEKKEILRQIISCLKSVQSLGQLPTDEESCREAYLGKTFRRLEKVRELVPFAQDESVVVNGRRCRNVFYCRGELERRLARYFPPCFKLIHGDCTFSNTMLREDRTPVLIDPRGYFGFTELYGDPAYDWAKLYYSIVGNYDQFNRKRFSLEIGKEEVSLQIASNGWEDMEGEFFRLLQKDVTPGQIHLLHAIIWLSLTTYAWEDYDSICGAFYNGIYYLEEALNEDIF